MKRPLTFVAVIASMAWNADAVAGGFAIARYTGEHGHPTTDNGSAIYYNPAALTRGQGIRLLLDANLAPRGDTTEGRAARTHATPPPGFEDANVGTASLTNILVGPTLALTGKFGDVGLGIGAHVPFGGYAKWDKNEKFEGNGQYAGPVDGVQRWQGIAGQIRSVYFTAAGAYELADQLSLGLALNLIRSRVDTSRARLISGGGDADITKEGRSTLETDGTEWSFGAGVLWEAAKDELWLGLSYQAQPNISGGMTLEGKEKGIFPNPTGSTKLDDDAQLHQTLPDIVRWGAAYRPDPLLELRLFGDYERWSVFENQCVTRGEAECEIADDGSTIKGDTLQVAMRKWNDTIGVRAGVSKWTDDTRDLEIFGGLGYDGNAAPPETMEPTLGDATKLHVGAGGRFGLAEKIHLAASYTHLLYLPRDTTGESELATYRDQTTVADSGGKYASWVGILNVNIEVGF